MSLENAISHIHNATIVFKTHQDIPQCLLGVFQLEFQKLVTPEIASQASPLYYQEQVRQHFCSLFIAISSR